MNDSRKATQLNKTAIVSGDSAALDKPKKGSASAQLQQRNAERTKLGTQSRSDNEKKNKDIKDRKAQAEKESRLRELYKKLHHFNLIIRNRVGDPVWEVGPGIALLKECNSTLNEIHDISNGLKSQETQKEIYEVVNTTSKSFDRFKMKAATEQFAEGMDNVTPNSKVFAVTESARKIWAKKAIEERKSLLTNDNGLRLDSATRQFVNPMMNTPNSFN